MTGLTPADAHVAEVHDFFTGIESISYEDLGFADRFEADKLVEAAEVTSISGSLPVNPSGGRRERPKSHNVWSSSNSCPATPATRSTVHELRWPTISVARLRYPR